MARFDKGNIHAVSTKDMSREEWISQRRKTIGGSDASGIVGLSKYSSRFSIWADKTGRLPDKPDNEAMRIGRDLEEYVARRFCEQNGKAVRRKRAMLYNAKYPFAHADIDREIVGEDAGLECKTTSTLDVKQFYGVEFPEQYYVQCVHYLAVTGKARWYLAVLVFGRGFFTYTLERDEAEIEALMQAEKNFWDSYVIPDSPPPPDGSEATTETLSTLYTDSANSTVELFGRESVLEEYAGLKAQKKAIDNRISEIENLIKSDLKESEHGTCGGYIVTWKSQTRKSFQIKDFVKDNPETDLSAYFKESISRPFYVKKS